MTDQTEGYLEAIMNAPTSEPPKCKCGQVIGLAVYEGRCWCPDCLWAEIVNLRAIVDLLPKKAGKPVVPGVNPDDGTAERLGIVFRYSTEAAKTKRTKG